MENLIRYDTKSKQFQVITTS
jgi:hypothetical protein